MRLRPTARGTAVARGLVVLGLVACSEVGCGEKTNTGASPDAATASEPLSGQGLPSAAAGSATAAGAVDAPGPTPESAADFLTRLAPVPAGAVRVVYELRGPGGSHGELEVRLASGMRRAERWKLRMPKPGAESFDMAGSAIMHPDRAWAGRDGEAGVSYPLPFAEIGQAYMAADAEQRDAWVSRIDAWHRALATARQEAPGDREEVAGVSCLVMQMAGQALCLWEETGLPLRHSGGAFELTATSIEKDVSFDAAAFALPKAAAAAKQVSAPDSVVPAAGFFELLERQDTAALTVVLTPGLRLPDPAQLGAATAPPK